MLLGMPVCSLGESRGVSGMKTILLAVAARLSLGLRVLEIRVAVLLLGHGLVNRGESVRLEAVGLLVQP